MVYKIIHCDFDFSPPPLSIPAFSSSLYLTTAATVVCLVSSVVSAYLMYILTYVISTVCLVCLPVHFINLLLLILYIIKWQRLTVQSRTKQE